MALRDLTKPELRKIIENANFTEDEMMVFQLSSNGSPIDYIADTMKISSSTVNRILRKIFVKVNFFDLVSASFFHSLHSLDGKKHTVDSYMICSRQSAFFITRVMVFW